MLSYNSLKIIPDKIKNLVKLETLTLEGNPLTSLPMDQLIDLLVKKSCSLVIDKKHQGLFAGKSIKNIFFRWQKRSILWIKYKK